MLAVAVALATVVFDQLTKAAVVGSLEQHHSSPVLGVFIRLTHIRNSGAVFGMMRGAGTYFTFFSIIAAAVLVVVLFFARRSSTLVRLALGMVLGGAVGNLIDRLRYGAVVDFIDVGINESVRWACFNVADSAITVGVFLLILSSFMKSQDGAGEEAADRGADRAAE